MRIVTLSQLEIMPIGTVVSPIKSKDGWLEFDCQGVLQLEPQARLTAVNQGMLTLTSLLPDIRLVEGEVKADYHPGTDYVVPNWYPHRFVVWENPPCRST